MYIDFKKYPFVITNVKFNEDKNKIYDDCYQEFIIETDGNKNFKFIAIGDCCSYSVFKVWEDYDFNKLIGRVIVSMKASKFPDDFEPEGEDDDDYYASYHLYEMKFVDSDEVFKFMLINYSNGYYDGWINAEIVNK